MVGIVGAHGQLTQSAILRNPRTKYNRSKYVFSVTSIALNCGHTTGYEILKSLCVCQPVPYQMRIKMLISERT